MSSSDRPIAYTVYRDERQLPDIIALLEADLSEPYSIYTYRYFIHGWPSLCFLVSSIAVYIVCFYVSFLLMTGTMSLGMVCQ